MSLSPHAALLAFALLLSTIPLMPPATAQNVPTILTFGDSITEGGKDFVSYRQVLIDELTDKNIDVQFIGPRKDETSAHGGFSGKSSADLKRIAASVYEKHPADIVLLHSGHNHFAREQPVRQILLNTQEIIRTFNARNPKVTVLLAQVIPAGKLPKYSYIPELNQGLAKLANRLQGEGLAIKLVDQASDFDWNKHTISDHVHPNRQGAQIIAEKWLTALLPILGHTDLKSYQKLRLWDGKPPWATDNSDPERKLPDGRTTHVGIPSLDVYRPLKPNGVGLIICSGGGYKKLASGPLGLGAADEFLSDGFTVFSLKYRLSPPSKNVVRDATADGARALRIIRSHAEEWELDPTRIGMIGFSAGANLILNLVGQNLVSQPTGRTALEKLSAKPDFMILAALWRHDQNNIGDFLIGDSMPPAFILAAQDDSIAPAAEAKELAGVLRAAGNHAKLEIYQSGGHLAFKFPNLKAKDWPARLRQWLKERKIAR